MKETLWVPGPWFSWRERAKVDGRWNYVEKTGRHPAPKGNSKQARIVPRKHGKPFAQVVPHPATVAAEAALVAALLPLRPARPIEGAVELAAEFVMPIADSWPAWKREAALAGMLPCLKRAGRGGGDRGNFLKMIEDALDAAGFYADDCAVTSGPVSKVYGPVPGYRITITPRGFGPRTHKEWKAWRR